MISAHFGLDEGNHSWQQSADGRYRAEGPLGSLIRPSWSEPAGGAAAERPALVTCQAPSRRASRNKDRITAVIVPCAVRGAELALRNRRAERGICFPLRLYVQGKLGRATGLMCAAENLISESLWSV